MKFRINRRSLSTACSWRLSARLCELRVHAAAWLWLLLPGLAVAQTAPVSLPLEGTQLDVDVHGNIFVLDTRQATLTQYDPALNVQTVAGGPGWEAGQFDQAAGLWAKNGLDIYVADYGNHRIERFDRTLSFVSSLSTREAEDASTRFGYPTDVTVSRLGSLFICDSENSRILKVDQANRIETTFGGFGGGAGRLQHPVQVEIGPNDAVYVLDPPRVVAYDNFGNFLTAIGEGILENPRMIAADDRGLIVLDGTDLVCLTESHRPLPRIAIAGLTVEAVEPVQSLSLAGDRLYILGNGRLVIAADPRPHAGELEKDGNSE
jgi:hypothetical protein